MKDTTVPLTLISLLADGEFHSGEQLGERLGMSRAAINKHIQTLRDWGVDVFTVPGKGYSLPEPIQLLDADRIHSQLDSGNVAVLPVIDSTNQYLLDRIGELRSGDACVAEYQQAGVVVAGVNGSHRLVRIYIFQCTGVWSRGLRRQ
ncbi:bifunctional protein: biotin operon repressor and biotin-[acetyl-CoA carboxylase] synthetase [Salmonella enterica subsp. enterica]|uniref:Bifunctional protein: biotin operon repressor and biotin-[acetyl-CoA carboxylase] synthetase n=1 Tax=Salmonella enterica I TaxID=59201 RepID=A0A379X3J4_SALET|nr:bifunctional protein: biotin operon repressor and biotin-[acetyl-CoA carboxylase] synthetase [Salmonella enterica subsp. enterica]